jgi:hypothetical protein
MCNYITLLYKVAVSYLERTPTLVIASLMKCELWVRRKEEHDKGKTVEKTGKKSKNKRRER